MNNGNLTADPCTEPASDDAQWSRFKKRTPVPQNCTVAASSDHTIASVGASTSHGGTILLGPSNEVYPSPIASVTVRPKPSASPAKISEAAEIGEWARIEQALAEDEDYLSPEESAVIAKGDRSAALATASVPLLRVNRANLRALLSNLNLDYELRCSLLNFLSRYRRSRWMQWQKQYPQRIGIAVAAGWDCDKAIALCGVRRWHCQKPDYCPRCALIERAKPAVREYRHSFLRADYWYAVTPSFEVNPNRAGLRFVVQKRDKVAGIKERVIRFNPYRGLEPGVRLTPEHHAGADTNPVTACFDAVFQFAERMVRNRVVGGAFAHREVAWHFRPLWIAPHGHLLVNTSEPLSFEHGKLMLRHFEHIYAQQPEARLIYPDLHIEPLVSQRELNRWLFYILKPMDFVTGYVQSIQAGVDTVALNMEVDDRIFQGGCVMLSVRSPRRFGNLRCNGDGYIGSGSVTAWRKEQAARRKLNLEWNAQPIPKRPPAKSRIAHIIERESALRNPELQAH